MYVINFFNLFLYVPNGHILDKPVFATQNNRERIQYVIICTLNQE